MKTFTVKTINSVETVTADDIIYGQRVIMFTTKAAQNNSAIFTGDVKDDEVINFVYENVVSIKEEK